MARDKKSESGASETGVARWKSASTEGSTDKGKGKNKSKASKSGGSRKQKRPRAAETRQQLVLLVVALVLVVASVVAIIPPATRLGWGLDFSGGSYVKLVAEGAETDDVEDAAGIIEDRLDAAGIKGYRVSVQDDGSVLVQFPDDDDQSDLVNSIVETGYLEFVRVDAISDASALAKIEAGSTGIELEEGSYTAFLDSSDVTSVQVSVYSSSEGTYYLTLDFDDDAATTFEEVTGLLASTYGQIAIVVDGVVVSAPTVSSAIEGGTVSIYSGFSYEEAVGLASAVSTGELPVDFEVSESGTVDPVMGTQELVIAAVVAVVALLVVLVVLYKALRGLALVAFAALVASCVFEVGILGLLSSVEFFVPSVVGYLGGVAAVVAAFVLFVYLVGIFRGEVREGKLPREAARGIFRSCTTQISVAAVVLFAVGLLLYLLAPANLDDFGLALAVGVLVAGVSTGTVFVALLRLEAAGSMREKPEFWGLSASTGKSR